MSWSKTQFYSSFNFASIKIVSLLKIDHDTGRYEAQIDSRD